ncbi:hypothetical protein A4H97_18675 [Niastella yeongjuensis]|uniref:Uncharacterized protein n=1 Tax=Niastella yeongjuensis TaxID=354355 RepID=A0A1V9DYA3_9BACT|nr:hypothetical protein [Niastella yeongjuensis]OQP38744.1 hypothetical protein A4H97_18675 [Niastella yeongjuensis]
MKGKLVNILLHVLFTALIVVVPIVLIPMKESDAHFIQWPGICFTALETAGFYFNAYVLYPRFLLKKRIFM